MSLSTRAFLFNLAFVFVLIFMFLARGHRCDNSEIITNLKPGVYQTKGFSNASLTSGPILVVDKKTLFISNIKYTAQNAANFWAGTNLSTSNPVLIPDEKNSTDILKSYNGENLYLYFPENMTTDKIDFLSLGTRDKIYSVGHVMLYKNASGDLKKKIPEADGFAEKTKNNKTIFRVPKCCKLNQYLNTNNKPKCEENDVSFDISSKVFFSNATHIDDTRFIQDTIEFVPYWYDLVCPVNYSRIAFDNETDVYGLIFNSSVIFSHKFIIQDLQDQQGLLNHGQFCMESDNQTVYILYCYLDEVDGPPTIDVANAYLTYFYVPLLIISLICYLVCLFCYTFLLKKTTVHRQCIIGYCASMFFSFLFLILLQFVNHGCNYLGSFFIYSTYCAFICLTCLCVNLVFVFRNLTEDALKDKIPHFLLAVFVAPVIFILPSLILKKKPDVPISFMKTYITNKNLCEFGESAISFFTVTGILLCVNFTSLFVCLFYANAYKKNNNETWRNHGNKFKFIFSILIFTIFSYILELLSNYLDPTHLANNLIGYADSLQGIFFFFLLMIFYRKEKRADAKMTNTNKTKETIPLNRYPRLRSNFMLLITNGIWLVSVGVAHELNIEAPLTIIEALQGIFALIIFILHKYIRKELRDWKQNSFKVNRREAPDPRETELMENFGWNSDDNIDCNK